MEMPSLARLCGLNESPDERDGRRWEREGGEERRTIERGWRRRRPWKPSEILSRGRRESYELGLRGSWHDSAPLHIDLTLISYSLLEERAKREGLLLLLRGCPLHQPLQRLLLAPRSLLPPPHPHRPLWMRRGGSICQSDKRGAGRRGRPPRFLSEKEASSPRPGLPQEVSRTT